MNWRRHLAPRVSSRDCAGFTRADLAAVLVIFLLFALIVPLMIGSTDVRNGSAVCVNNHRRLVLSWLLYVDDSEGRVVNNMGIPGTINAIESGRFNNWANNIMGWSVTGSTADISNTNLDWATKGLLVPYGKGATDIYRCPADIYVGPQQRSRGHESRVRSVSMNAFFGRFDPNSPGDSTAGGRNWFLPQYRQFLKLSDVLEPPRTWVTLDEHADSINDGCFINADTQTSWGDIPASYHNGACVFSFVDGHSEIHTWRSTTSQYPVRYSYMSRPFDAEGRLDFQWYKERVQFIRR